MAWRFRSCLLGIVLLVPAAAGRAAEPDLALLRKAGGYVMLLDADRRPIAGNYWLSPGLKVRIKSRGPGSYPEPLVYADRDFPRGRIANMYLFLNAKETTTPDIAALPVGEAVSVTREREQIGLAAGKAQVQTVTYTLTTIALISESVAGVKLLSRVYEIEPADPASREMDWGRRVYIETLDLDLSREQAAKIAHIETGTAGSSGDFEGIFFSRALAGGAYAACMEEKRASPEYQEAVRRERMVNDAWMAKDYLATGIAWWEREDAAKGIGGGPGRHGSLRAGAGEIALSAPFPRFR